MGDRAASIVIEVRNDRVWVRLPELDVELLSSLPRWLADVGVDPNDVAGPRMRQSAYPDDPVASAEFEVNYGAALDEARNEDRQLFAESVPAALEGVELTEEQAEAWMRVVGDARLVFAARLGIDDTSWEGRDGVRAEHRFLHYLTYLQGRLIEALEALME